MTFVYKSVSTNNYYIELSQNKFESIYRVTVHPIITDSIVGNAISKRTYNNEKTALKGFAQAVKYYA